MKNTFHANLLQRYFDILIFRTAALEPPRLSLMKRVNSSISVSWLIILSKKRFNNSRAHIFSLKKAEKRFSSFEGI